MGDEQNARVAGHALAQQLQSVAAMKQLLACLAIATTACGPVYHPKRPTPEPTLPSGFDPDQTPTEPGTGQVVLDTVGESADVVEVLATESWRGTYVAGFAQRTRPVCSTPCVANLPYGAHLLRFASRTDAELDGAEMIDVTRVRRAHRYDMQRTKTHTAGMIGGIILFSFGITAAIAGGAVGLATDSPEGGTVALIGAGMAVGGGLLWNSSRTEIEPGSLTSWSLQ